MAARWCVAGTGWETKMDTGSSTDHLRQNVVKVQRLISAKHEKLKYHRGEKANALKKEIASDTRQLHELQRALFANAAPTPSSSASSTTTSSAPSY
jgi:hypothetical protein